MSFRWMDTLGHKDIFGQEKKEALAVIQAALLQIRSSPCGALIAVY